ncbi:GHKL domain-containing protein [Eubacterium sp. MSJ-13]|uniref:sensor histidine kinase n=1 Tax=Eubacterium sp. MSJ-13 TaxID=2841513 RepID=UPI001C11463D|nr:sensor histidine kinase [Eubacterium sp. MSJ-13]MBU5478288.1 GHKL domain-containing protein [Eubacterium sp. MSJ-13]
MNVYQSYVIVLIEMSCFLIFNTAFSKCELRFPKWVWIIWLVIMSSAIFVISDIFEQNILLRQVVNIIIFIVGSIAIGKKSIKNAIMVSALFDFIFVIADVITILLDRDVLQIDMNGEGHIDAFITLMSKSVLLIIILVLKKVGSDRWLHISEEKDIMFLAVFPLISAGAVAGILKCGIGLKSENEIQFAWVVVVSLIAMNILVIFFMDDLAEKARLKQEKLVFEMDAKRQREMYDSWEEKLMRQRSISHEYRNNLLYMSALLEKKEYSKLSEYLKKVSGEYTTGMDIINTNNPVVNVLMNTKYYEAKKAGASFICKINDLSGITMEETDLILVVSNLLNNAIEAVQKCSDNKVVKVKIVIENGKLIVSVRNTYNGKIKKDGDEFKTTKKENSELHGIGIKNVIRITEKYHGLHLFETCGEEFSAVVIIPMEVDDTEAEASTT